VLVVLLKSASFFVDGAKYKVNKKSSSAEFVK